MNPYERILKLLGSILGMVVDGTRDPEKVAEALELVAKSLQLIVSEPRLFVKKYLRRLFETETITIPAGDGSETFESSGLFTGRIYGVSIPAKIDNPTATPEVLVNVHEMVEDGEYSVLFGSLGKAGEPEYEQSQVVDFCRIHPDKLRTGGYGTFFRLKGGLVAYVLIDDGGRLHVRVYEFSDVNVWRAECRLRLVAPQQ